MEVCKKIMLTATGGGHFEQLKKLDSLRSNYNIVYVVAKTRVNKRLNNVKFVYDYENQTFLKKYLMFIIIFWQSLFLLMEEKPDVVISTGAASTFWLCYLQKKLFKKKVIYIESFAKQTSTSKTGRLVYKFADYFIVQWDSMLEFYPDAIMGGSIY